MNNKPISIGNAASILTSWKTAQSSIIYMFSELIDNALQSFDDKGYSDSEGNKIIFDIDLKEKSIFICDNALGIDKDKNPHITKISQEVITDGKSMFNKGLKNSSFWLGDGFEFVSRNAKGELNALEYTGNYMKKNDNSLVYRVVDNQKDFTKNQIKCLEKLNRISPNGSGTVICIPRIHKENTSKEDLNKPINRVLDIEDTFERKGTKKKIPDGLINFLSFLYNKYRKTIKNKEANIIFNYVSSQGNFSDNLLDWANTNSKILYPETETKEHFISNINTTRIKDPNKEFELYLKNTYLPKQYEENENAEQTFFSTKEVYIENIFKKLSSDEYWFEDKMEVIHNKEEYKIDLKIGIISSKHRSYSRHHGFTLIQHNRAIVFGPNIDNINEKFYNSNLTKGNRNSPQTRIFGEIIIPSKLAVPDDNKQGFDKNLNQSLEDAMDKYLKKSGLISMVNCISTLEKAPQDTNSITKKGGAMKSLEISNKQITEAKFNIDSSEYKTIYNTDPNDKTRNVVVGFSLTGITKTFKDLDNNECEAKLNIKINLSNAQDKLLVLNGIETKDEDDRLYFVSLTLKHNSKFWNPSIDNGEKSETMIDMYTTGMLWALVYSSYYLKFEDADDITSTWLEIINSMEGI